MTAIAATHYANMDLLRADDHMDLVSSPAVPTEDIDFDLDDVPEVSTEPNQDLMLQDEPDHPTADSKNLRSALSFNVDDDLMIDEENLIQEEDQTELPDLSMDNHQDDHAQVDEDDDILYEDEEDLQKQEGIPDGLPEKQQMDDGVKTEDPQMTPRAQIPDGFDDLLAEAEFDITANEGSQGVVDVTNNTSGQLQTASVNAAANDSEKSGANTQTGRNILSEQDSVAVSLENSSGDDANKQEANEEDNLVDIEANEAETLELEKDATDGREQDTDRPKVVDDSSLTHTLESESFSHAQASVDSAHEEGNGQSSPHFSMPHTVKVHYLETEMCLFPPTEDDDLEMFFLQDVSLAYESVDKMLAACRDVLANTIGEDDELVLDIASLGLHISEGSRYAAQITLSQIIDVYVALAHNDNVATIEPLYCSLSSRVCLASQYAYLQSAVNEGKTLTRISEENMYGIGEDRGDESEDKYAQVHDQGVPIESKEVDGSVSEDKKVATSITSERAQALKSVDAAKGGSDYQSNKGQSESNIDKTAVTNEIDSKKAEPEEEEPPLNPTVKGNSDGLEGDYDIFLNLCFKPGICSCSSCTNINADIAAAASNTNESEEVAEDIFGDTARYPDDTGLTDANVAGKPDDIEWPGIDTNVQGSVSSRTLESEKNEPEEDLFSPDNGQTFLGGNYDHTDSQHDEEDFELEEHNHPDVSLELNDGLLDEPEHRNDHDDLDQGQVAPSSTFGLGNDIGAGDSSYRGDHNGAHGEGDDELLNFDDNEEVQGEEDEKQRTSLSTHQSLVAGDETTNSTSASKTAANVHDVTTTPRNEIVDPKDDLLSTTLDPRQIQSPLGQSINDTSSTKAGDPPTTPSGSKNGFKRKAVEEEDEFDLFDTATPDKKRRRPS